MGLGKLLDSIRYTYQLPLSLIENVKCIQMANRNQFTPNEEKIDAALAEVVAANVDQ